MAQTNEWRRAAKAFYGRGPGQIVKTEIIRPGRYSNGEARMGVQKANDLGAVKDPGFNSKANRDYLKSMRTDSRTSSSTAPSYPVKYIE